MYILTQNVKYGGRRYVAGDEAPPEAVEHLLALGMVEERAEGAPSGSDGGQEPEAAGGPPVPLPEEASVAEPAPAPETRDVEPEPEPTLDQKPSKKGRK